MKKELLILPIILLFIGCSSDLEDSISKTEDCLEDKFDDEKSKYEEWSTFVNNKRISKHCFSVDLVFQEFIFCVVK